MNAANIWLLEVGKYLDRRIVGVFSDKSKVRDMAELIGGCVLGPYTIDQKLDYDISPEGMEFFHIRMRKNGEVRHVYKRTSLDENGKLRECLYRTEFSKNELSWRLWLNSYAKDELHIVRIANDISMRIISGLIKKEGPLEIRHLVD